MNMQDMSKAVITAVLAYQDEYKANHDKEQMNLVGMSDDEKEDYEEEYPEDVEEEAFWESFTSWVAARGLASFAHITIAGKDADKILTRLLSERP